jgi:hypothetical protein
MKRQTLILLACLCCAGIASPDERGPKEELGDGWQVFVAPGPIVSGHVPNLYTIDKEDGTIVRAKDKEDQARLGMATFAVLYNADRLDSFGIAVGIGMDTDQQIRYYLGGGYRFGSRAAIIGGVAIGPVPRLPVHLNEGDPYTGDLLQEEWASRIEFGWFAGFTWTVWDSLGGQG